MCLDMSVANTCKRRNQNVKDADYSLLLMVKYFFTNLKQICRNEKAVLKKQTIHVDS